MKIPIQIEPVSDATREPLRAAAAADGHVAPRANHVFLRDGKIIGAASLLIPTTVFWADSKNVHARETIDLIRRVQEMAGPSHFALCAPYSPIHPLMMRFGYKRLGNVDIFQALP